jgi:hypothetical protein
MMAMIDDSDDKDKSRQTRSVGKRCKMKNEKILKEMQTVTWIQNIATAHRTVRANCDMDAEHWHSPQGREVKL